MVSDPQANAKILVVDDEAGIVRLLVRALAAGGYENVRGVTDATEVPAYLDSETPDLVVLDLNMPGMDGFALLSEISERLSENAFLPVMAVSGMSDRDSKERAFRSGAKDFLAKPVDLQEFILHVNSLLETRFLSLRLLETQDRLADLVGVRTEELQKSEERTQEAEQALHLSEEQMRLLSLASGVALGFYTADGTALFVNDVAGDLFGFDAEDAVGRHLSTFMPASLAERVLSRIKKVAETGERTQFESELLLASGREGWFLSTYSRVVDSTGRVRGVQVVSIDITERRAAEERLLESEERFQKAFHSNPAPSTIAKLDGRIIDANAAWLAMTGYSRDEVIGRTSLELGILTGQYRELMVAAAESGVAGDPIEVQTRTKRGDVRTVLARAEYVDIGGEKCLLATGIDITERKTMEESLLLSQISLDNAAEAIFWFDADGGLQYVNEFGRRAYGYSTEEVGRLTVLDFDPDVTPEKWAEEWRTVKQRGALTFNARPQRKGGERFDAEITNTYLRHGGKELAILFVRDVTEKRQAMNDLQQAYTRLRSAQGGTLRALASVTEFRDPYTAGHQRNVAKVAVRIAQNMGLPEHQIVGIRIAATVHDVGKIAVPIEILSSPSQLSPDQQTIVREHVNSGFEILSPISFEWPVAEIVRQHHERLDGSGYPRGLGESEILLEARILAVADTAEAMISHRPYRPAIGVWGALEELKSNAGRLYDRDAVEALMRIDLERLLAEDDEPNVNQLDLWGRDGGERR